MGDKKFVDKILELKAPISASPRYIYTLVNHELSNWFFLHYAWLQLHVSHSQHSQGVI